MLICASDIESGNETTRPSGNLTFFGIMVSLSARCPDLEHIHALLGGDRTVPVMIKDGSTRQQSDNAMAMEQDIDDVRASIKLGIRVIAELDPLSCPRFFNQFLIRPRPSAGHGFLLVYQSMKITLPHKIVSISHDMRCGVMTYCPSWQENRHGQEPNERP